MIEGIPRISVLVICYKQENLIGRALDSLISQKDYLYEICISDDCSPDDTWQILLDYQEKYPDLIKLNRNEPNIGIFENYEKTWNMPTGDIIYTLAGDDKCGEGWFKKVVDYIFEYKIDYQNELFCIYGDYLNKYPNGDSFRFSNKLSVSGINVLKLSFRGLIGNRSTCFSVRILKKFKKVSKGRSHIAEDAQDRQLQFFSQRNYYIPYVGNIYYANIGTCIKINDDILAERKKIRPYAIKLLESWGAKLDKHDLCYSLKYFNAFHWANHHPSLKNRLIAIYWYLRSYDPQIGLKGVNFRRFAFLIIKRLPHKKPINW